MTKCTVLGSCRQAFMNNSFIQPDISYPHYTKEILQLIKYCKYGETVVKQNETNYTFRTPILHNKELEYSDKIFNEFNNTDIFLIEIASKIVYKYQHLYLHHIAHDQHYKSCSNIKNDIITYNQDYNEIETDILEIKKELGGKPFIIVSHMVTKYEGERYKLSCWLEEICTKYDIPFINPMKEIHEKHNITDEEIPNLFSPNEKTFNHLSGVGINYMRTIYKDKINIILA